MNLWLLLRIWLIVVTQPGAHLNQLTINQAINQQGEWLCPYAECRNKVGQITRGGFYYGGAIAVIGVDGAEVCDNHLSGGVTGILVLKSQHVHICRNTIENVSAWGILAIHSSDLLIEDNVVNGAQRSCPDPTTGLLTDGCESAGFMLLDVQHSVLQRNSCWNGGDCFYANGEGLPSNDNQFLDNVCVSSPHNCFEITFSSGNTLDGNTARGEPDQGRACLYPFWISGSRIHLGRSNHWSCIKTDTRAFEDSRDATPAVTERE